MTAILINGQELVIANVGDSRAVICKNGKVKQLSVDHEPSKEKGMIESRGGFVSNIPGILLYKIILQIKHRKALHLHAVIHCNVSET